jgi:hypothetical protein
VETGDDSGGDEPDLRVFAGRRADPFFSDVVRVRGPHRRDKAEQTGSDRVRRRGFEATLRLTEDFLKTSYALSSTAGLTASLRRQASAQAAQRS